MSNQVTTVWWIDFVRLKIKPWLNIDQYFIIKPASSKTLRLPLSFILI
jgi:hypothetical protein